MKSLTLALTLTLSALAFIENVHASPTKRQCVTLQIPIKTSTTATKWLQPRVDNNIDTIDWVMNMTTWTSPTPSERAIGKIDINQTFNIHGQLCVPKTPTARSSTLHLATHGVGFDKRYWDADIKPAQYSYVDAVLSEGYSIFTYDRLGTGGSDKPDAYNVVQASVQIEILRQLTLLARAGKLVTSSKKLSSSTSTLDRYTPAKIIHVGHSYGSVATAGLITIDGSLSDGALLTGFLVTSTDIGMGPGVAGWGFEYAKSNDPVRFGDRGSGYIVPATKTNLQISFLKKGSFEPLLLDYAEKIKQPNTVGEFASLPEAVGGLKPAPKGKEFKGPVQFFIGEYDYAFCRGDCKGTYDEGGIKKSLYPAAKAVEVYLQPETGHGLTLSTNATAGYQVMFDFLHASGL